MRGLIPVERVSELIPVEQARGLIPVEQARGLIPVERVRGLIPVERVRGLIPVERVRQDVHIGFTGCLALRTRNGRLKNSFNPGGTLPTHPAGPKSGHVT